MSLNATPSSERTHIGFFGRTNAGKSSLVNAIAASDLAIVSSTPGTTTDPVLKSMEILPLGPVVLIDTAGLDDESELGLMRVSRSKRELFRCDIAVLVLDATNTVTDYDRQILDDICANDIPLIIVINKIDEINAQKGKDLFNQACDMISSKKENVSILQVSAKTGDGINELKEAIAHIPLGKEISAKFISDYLTPNDTVVLVCPIDESAPKGRMILPQQLAIRDILDANAKALVVKETELASLLSDLKNPPRMVITDSQAFKIVSEIVPADIPLTSFSILMARYKGFLDTAVNGIKAIDNLKDGDIILMAEGCTHHRQCNDIGTVKIPNWIKKYTGKDIIFETSSGKDFPSDLSKYSLIIHCGGCMITEKEIRFREKCAKAANIPFTNYGITIAKMTGALDRSLEIINHDPKA